jgi:hypothetical protein
MPIPAFVSHDGVPLADVNQTPSGKVAEKATGEPLHVTAARQAAKQSTKVLHQDKQKTPSD